MGLKIIICGGGIGGLTAAGYLRAHHSVTVLERGPVDLPTDDYGLSVVSNAFGLLEKAGIKAANLDGVVMTHLWVRSYDNAELKTVHFDTRRQFGGAPSIMTRRAKLQKELLRFATGPEFAGEAAQVVGGARVARVDAAAGKVWTEDGREFEGDLVVGADGINSVVRSAVLQPPPPPVRLHDLLIFITKVPIDMIQSDPSLAYLADPARQAGLVTFQAPRPSESRKRLLMYHTSTRELQVLGYTSEGEFAAQFDAAKTAIIKDVPAARVTGEFAPEFNESLVGLFRHGQIDAWRIRDVDTCSEWCRGRAVLIGDAAHAVTPHAGQGCNITIEDAEALGYLLRDSESSDDLGPILQKFVALRKDRARFVLRRSREMGNIQSDEDKALGPISPEKFAMVMHSYQGVENALKAAGSSAAAT